MRHPSPKIHVKLIAASLAAAVMVTGTVPTRLFRVDWDCPYFSVLRTTNESGAKRSLPEGDELRTTALLAPGSRFGLENFVRQPNDNRSFLYFIKEATRFALWNEPMIISITVCLLSLFFMLGIAAYIHESGHYIASFFADVESRSIRYISNGPGIVMATTHLNYNTEPGFLLRNFIASAGSLTELMMGTVLCVIAYKTYQAKRHGLVIFAFFSSLAIFYRPIAYTFIGAFPEAYLENSAEGYSYGSSMVTIADPHLLMYFLGHDWVSISRWTGIPYIAPFIFFVSFPIVLISILEIASRRNIKGNKLDMEVAEACRQNPGDTVLDSAADRLEKSGDVRGSL